MNTRAAYTITPRGRALLRSPAVWALTRHTRDLLALCDPRVIVANARQFLPPESLHAALYSLRELGLIEGPAVQAPGEPESTMDRLFSGRNAKGLEGQSTTAAT